MGWGELWEGRARLRGAGGMGNLLAEGKARYPHCGPELFCSTPANPQPITGVGGREVYRPGTSMSAGRDQHLALGVTLAARSGM